MSAGPSNPDRAHFAGRQPRRCSAAHPPEATHLCASGRAARSAAPHRSDTRVELLHVDDRAQDWIRFGRVACDKIVDRRHRAVWFAAGAVFAYVRWRSNGYGTVVSRIDILRASRPGESIITVPGVTPGGVALLRIAGWPRVARVLVAIDQVEAIGMDPSDACPDHWQHVHNRISAGAAPRPYTAERHRAWLFRRVDFLC